MKEIRKNPFKPSFGSVPVSMAGRRRLIEDILGGLDNAPGDPNRASIFVGARGTGKTVLLTLIAEEAEKNGWLSANITTEKGMLEELLVQVQNKGEHLLKKQTLSHIAGLQIGALGLTLETKDKKTTWRAELTAVIKELNDKGTGLLITVDEVSPKSDELHLLVNVFQHLIRERLEVAILFAGLPRQVSLLLREDDVSFLRRAFQHSLGSIETSEVVYAMKETIESAGRKIDDNALIAAAEATDGFAFLIQLIGYHIWRINEKTQVISKRDVKQGITLAMHDMEHMILTTTMREIAPKEKAYLMAMLDDADVSNVADISKRMKTSQNSASQLRHRLIERGVIEERGRGRVAYAIPYLREYLEKSR